MRRAARRLGELDRTILALALPALATLAADPLVSLVDTAFVGRLGAAPLAALGVNTALFSLVFLVFNFLAYGTTPMVSRALGGGDRPKAHQVVGHALFVAVAAGVVALIALQLLAEPLLRVMGTSGELMPDALAYLRVRACAGPALLLITAGNGAYRGFLDTRTPLKLTLLLNVVNAVLDPLFIFGFGWGLVGAAYATAIAQWVGALAFVLGLVRGPEKVPLPRALPAWSEIAPFLRIGGDMLLRTTSLVGTLTLATAVAARVGVVELAAHQVASQLWLFLSLTVDSVAVAAQALVAAAAARGQGEARRTSDRLLVWGFALGVFQAAVFLLAKPLLVRLFTSDPAVMAALDVVYPFIVFVQPLNSLVFVLDGVFMGAERFRFLARAMLVAAGVTSGLLLLVLPSGLGLIGVWWAMTALMVVRGLTLAYGYLWAPAALAAR